MRITKVKEKGLVGDTKPNFKSYLKEKYKQK